MKTYIGIILMLASVAALCWSAAPAPASQNQQKAEVALRNAMEKETVDGDLNAAIEQYKKLASNPNRSVAAKALLRLGQCYEKQGNAEARKTFEELIANFQDQADAVAQARERLSSVLQSTSLSQPSFTMRRLGLNADDVYSQGSPSPDGRYLVYEDNAHDIVKYDIYTGTHQKLTIRKSSTGEYSHSIRWSPDGATIAFDWHKPDGTDEVRIMDASGSNLRTVYAHPALAVRLHDWFPDNKSLLVSLRADEGTLQVLRMLLEDGSTKPITQFTTRISPDLILSPDGRYIVANDFRILSVTDGTETKFLFDRGRVSYVVGWESDGKSIIFLADTGITSDLWQIRITNGRPADLPELLQPNLGNDIYIIGPDKKGSIFYYTYQVDNVVETSVLDWTNGRLLSPAKQLRPATSSSPVWSPDQSRLAYLGANFASRVFSSLCIWSSNDDSVKTLRLNTMIQADPSGHLTWSPDGRFLFGVNNAENLVRIDATNGEAVIRASRKGETVIGWMPDGQTIYSLGYDADKKNKRLLAIDQRSGNETELFQLNGSRTGWLWSGDPVSPDGHWIFVGISRPSEKNPRLSSYGLEAISTGNAGSRELVSTETIVRPVGWAPDSKYVLYRAGQDLWKVSLEGGNPIKLSVSWKDRGGISFHPDGKRVAFTSWLYKGDFWVMENIHSPKQAIK